MNEQEILEEIKNSYLEGLHKLFGTPWVSMPKENFDWLIEQAERAEKNAQDLEDMDKQLASEQKRVRELEKGIENLNELTDMQHEQNLRFHRQLNQLIRTNQRYKKALEYIRELAEYDEYENTVEQVYNCTKKALEETE